MQKFLIFLMLLFSASTWAMPSWNPYLMTHERFVHLSPEEQNKVILKTMEMIVELDGQTQKSLVNNERSQEHLEKYFVLIKKLQSFVMSEAFAQETDPSFLKLAQNFSHLLNKLGKEGCIYAGYVSRMVNGRCTNPSLLVSKGKNDEITRLIKNSYLNKTGQKDNLNREMKCAGEKKISCNPVVFGYKNNGSKIPFCVATSPNESHNSSYECMNKALSEQPEKGADSKEDRLNYIKSALKDAKAAPAFNAAHKFIYRTCVCGDTELNDTYKTYMRPHRTCFGMLNTLRNIESTECSALNTDTFKAGFAEEWNNYFGSSKFSPLHPKKDVPFDADYGALMSKQDMKVMCGFGAGSVATAGGEEVKLTDGTVCEAPCVMELNKDGKMGLTCTVTKVTVTKAGKETVHTKFKPAVYTPNPADKEISVTSEDGKETFICPIEAPEAEAKNKCEITSAVAEDKKTVTLTVTFPGEKAPEFTWSGDGKQGAEDPKTFVAPYTKEKKAVSVSIKSGPKAEAPDCTAEVGGDDAGGADDGKTYAIEAKADPYSAADLKIKVKAEVTVTGGDGKLPDSYKIIWVRQNYKGPAEPEKKILKEDDFKVKDGDAPAEKEVAATPEQPAATKEEAPGASTSEIDEPRVTAEYKSCAQLMDDKGAKVADSCAPIAPLGAGKPNNGPVNRPPSFMTPLFNTRTMGIQ